MSPSQGIRRPQRVTLIPLMALGAVALCFALTASSLVPGLILRSRQRRELSQVREELARVKVENRGLSDQVARLSDPSYVEVIARDRYNLAKPGETVYKVIDVPAPNPPRSKTVPKPAPTPWWRSAWRWLVGG